MVSSTAACMVKPVAVQVDTVPAKFHVCVVPPAVQAQVGFAAPQSRAEIATPELGAQFAALPQDVPEATVTVMTQACCAATLPVVGQVIAVTG